MTPALHMTRTQEKRFYRDAVQASLETFYGKSKPEAAKLVREWWTRLSATKAFESGIFLHSEPLNTAANIAGVPIIPISGQNRAKYHRILDKSQDLVLSKTMPLPSTAQRKKLEGDRHKQLFHLASPVASTRVTALQTLAKETKHKTPAGKHQVAYS
jgi:hypothetical protein